MLSGYRLMWIVVLFDLPVTTKVERKKATGFRNLLLDYGFQMAQFSVYMKHCGGKEQAEIVNRRLKDDVPENGSVKILQITDRQFGNIIHLGNRPQRSIASDQLALF